MKPYVAPDWLKIVATVMLYLFALYLLIRMGIILGNTQFSEDGEFRIASLLWKEWPLTLSWIAFAIVALVAAHYKLTGHKYEMRIILSSASKTLLIILPLIVGLYGSVTSSEFLKWVSPEEGLSGLPEHGVHIIAVMILAIILLAIRFSQLQQKLQRKQLKIGKKREKAQIKRTKMLKEVIQLAPPKRFPNQLAYYADILEDFVSDALIMNEEYEEIAETLTTEEEKMELWTKTFTLQREIIRAGLVAMARLAANYDNASLGTSTQHQYRANLMVSFKSDGNNGEDEQLRKFMEGEVNDVRYDIGFEAKPAYKLALNRHYSVKVSNDDQSLVDEASLDSPEALTDNGYIHKKFDFDEDVNSVIFPVYLDEKGAWRTHNIFGAPTAIATCHAQFIKDTSAQADDMRKKGYNEQLVKQVREYADKDDKGRSIICFPFTQRRFLDGHLRPEAMVGTINVYRNEKNMFSGDDDKFSSFTHFTLPLQVSLAKIILIHLWLLSLKPEY